MITAPPPPPPPCTLCYHTYLPVVARQLATSQWELHYPDGARMAAIMDQAREDTTHFWITEGQDEGIFNAFATAPQGSTILINGKEYTFVESFELDAGYTPQTVPLEWFYTAGEFEYLFVRVDGVWYVLSVQPAAPRTVVVPLSPAN